MSAAWQGTTGDGDEEPPGRRRRRRPAATRRRLTGASLVAMLAGAAAGTGAAAVAAPGAGASQPPISPGLALAAVTAAPRLPAGTHVLGAVPASATVSGIVALKLPSQRAVQQFIANVSNPRAADFHHYLPRGQFGRVFGPGSAAVAAVENQLKADGLQVTHVSSNGILVGFSGSASHVEAAFHTGLEHVRLADGSVGQATTSAVSLPSSIAHEVQAVVGLDQLVHENAAIDRSARRPRQAAPAPAPQGTGSPGPVACADALAQEAIGGLTDQQVAFSYGLDPLYGAGDVAAGQTVDIYELEPFAQSDVDGFYNCYFPGQSPHDNTTLVDGGPGNGPGSGEAALDVEDAAALAPAATIHVFSGPNMDSQVGPLDTWNAIAVADDASQISSSWGLCETAMQEGAPGVQQVENEIFEQAAAQGQTVFSAAGDDGSDDCAGHASTPEATNLSLDDPASQPYVVSVGGTTITDPTEPPSETVWNNGSAGGAGGGGISESWEMPSWQNALAVKQTSANEACSNDPTGAADDSHLAGFPTTLPAGSLCRETPDVSALADPQSGITIEYGGSWTVIGGTSSSTPLWAAMLAEMNGSSYCHAASIGFASPLLYQVGGSSGYSQAFSDVTVGNNDNLSVGSAVDYPAGTGYDLATGLGTPRVTDANGAPGLAQQLCSAAAGTSAAGAPPQVSALSSTSGPETGGGTTTITGSNLGSGAGFVYFGTVRAHVVSWATGSITVDVPAYASPPGTPAGAAGRALVTVVTSSGLSSAPSSTATYHYTASSPSGGPVVDYVSPANGPAGGSATGTIQIVGSGFTGATAVHFGDVAATIEGTPTDNEIAVRVPASDGACATPATQGLCAVAVTVTTPAGTSAGPSILPAYTGPIVYGPNGAFAPPAGCGCEIAPQPEEYDYASAPTITSISPRFASENGDSSAVVTGTGFNLLTFEWANIGPADGPFSNFSQDFSIEGVTPTTLTVGVSPAAATLEPQAMDFSVESAQQLSNVSTITYSGTPALSSISTPFGNQAGGGTLTIDGQGLSDVSSVVFQGQAPFDFLSSTTSFITAQSDSQLSVTIPNFFAIPTDVLVCSVTGCSAPDPRTDSFFFAYQGQPVVTSSGPSAGPAQGGTEVTIQGSLDSEVLSVNFGTAPAVIENEPFASPSGPITVLAPPGVAGRKVDVTVTTVGGELAGSPTSTVTSAATFTYRASSPTAPIAVAAVPSPGGATVTWRAPADDAGAAVTGYVVTASPTADTPKGTTAVRESLPATATKAVFPLLAHGHWNLGVYAVNRYGNGLAAGTSKPVLAGAPPAQGYWLATANGAVFASGHALPFVGASRPGSDPVTGIASTPDGGGYWLVTAHGLVIPRGDAPNKGEMPAGAAGDVVAIVPTDDGLGYWLLGANGQVFPFGDATFHGDLLHLPGGGQLHVDDIVGMEAAPNGTGYILVGSDGGVFAFGAVRFFGSLPGIGVKVHDIRSIIAAPAGTGYVLVGADGGAFVFGHGAPFEGSLPGRNIHVSNIVGLALTPDAQGYWMAGAGGATYAFGDAATFGTPAGLGAELPVAAIAGT